MLDSQRKALAVMQADTRGVYSATKIAGQQMQATIYGLLVERLGTDKKTGKATDAAYWAVAERVVVTEG